MCILSQTKIWGSCVKIWLISLISNFFRHNAASLPKSILKTNTTSIASCSLIEKSWSNFNLWATNAYLAPRYLIATVKEIAHRRTYLQWLWQCVWAQDWSGRVWQVRVYSICLCGKYLMHWILLSWAHLSSFPTLQLLQNELKLFLKQHCDNYLPKCWVNLSSNSRVIVTFFSFWSKKRVDRKSVLKTSTTVRKRSKNVTALVNVNLWFSRTYIASLGHNE